MLHEFSLTTSYLNVINIICYVIAFVSASLSYDNCSFHAQIERAIDNVGFHRNIDYRFNLLTNCSLSSCKLCLQEFIPPGLYVNKDQLDDLLRLDKLTASVDGNIDIEAPASKSPYLVVHIFKELISNGGTFSGNASLPIHLRYHDPQPGGGLRTFALDKPELYVYCSGLPLNLNGGVFLTECAGREKTLPYRKVSYNLKDESKLTVEVPVGDSDSFNIVFAGTFGVVIAGSVYLTGVLYRL